MDTYIASLVGPSHRPRHLASTSSQRAARGQLILIRLALTTCNAPPICFRGHIHLGGYCMSHRLRPPGALPRPRKECTPAKVPAPHYRNPRNPYSLHDVHPFLQDPTKPLHPATPPPLNALREDQGHTALEGRGKHPARTYRRVVDEIEHVRPQNIFRQVRLCPLTRV